MLRIGQLKRDLRESITDDPIEVTQDYEYYI